MGEDNLGFIAMLGVGLVALYLIWKYIGGGGSGFSSIISSIPGSSSGGGSGSSSTGGGIPDIPVATGGGSVGGDGTILLARPKAGGKNWYLNLGGLGTLPAPDSSRRVNPSGDGQIEFECGGAKLAKEGNLAFISLDRALPSSDLSLGAHNACRLHIMSHARGDDSESKVKYSWNSGAAESGYQVYPDDVKAAEWTIICRLGGILDPGDAISAKFGGAGHHTKPATNNQASCWEAHFQYGGSTSKKTFSCEFNHGTYERYNIAPENSYSNLNNRWFGAKIVSMPRTDKSARDIVTYFNENPVGADGRPNNTGWKRHTTWSQTTYLGKKAPHVWGGAKDTWRIDLVTKMDIAYASRVEIDAMPAGYTGGSTASANPTQNMAGDMAQVYYGGSGYARRAYRGIELASVYNISNIG